MKCNKCNATDAFSNCTDPECPIDQPISNLVEQILIATANMNRACSTERCHPDEIEDCAIYHCQQIIALVEPVIRAKLLDQAIEIVLAEPEKIQTSSSYRMGYARCARDKAELLRVLNKP